jgi:DNA polymerase-3 subunit gamma/tau
MGQALYRAHRPKKLADVVGQEHITTALTRALEKGTISHAYLFTGPRGVGKTTIARILAHEVNGLPYDDDSMHLDIIEIDAASNRRIDEIRDLRDKVHIAPTAAKYKVYIIDEVHMLTKEAFNALLKTLEEPPAHVVFILATTEAHKLPETIISRTQRYAFKAVDLPKVVGHLREMAESEKISIDDAALELIAAHGEGSFRDSISLLDQVRNSSEAVTLADVQATLGIAPKELIETLLAALAAHDTSAVAQALRAVHTGGHEPSQVAKQMGEALRSQILDGKPTLPHDIILNLLAKLLEVPSSADPKSYLEIALLDAALSGVPQARVASPGATPATRAGAAEHVEEVKGSTGPQKQDLPTPKEPEAKVMKEAMPAAPTVTAPHPSTFRKPISHPEDEEGDSAPTSTATLDKSVWPQILAAVKAKHNTIYSLVSSTQPVFDEPGAVQLVCAYAFHQKRLSEKKNKAMLADIIEAVTGEKLRIVCVVGEPNVPTFDGPPPLPPADEQVFTANVAPNPAERSDPVIEGSNPSSPATVAATPSSPSDPNVAAISNIFGGAELLES